MRILGFDLGDGESAVALLTGESTVEPRMLPLFGRSSMISAVGILNGRVAVGDEASPLSGARDVQVRFKSRYLTDPQAAGVVRSFAQGVLSQIAQEEPALAAEVTRTVVGCPAGWGEGRRAQYAALMESAGFPNVSVVPEPRAAFLYARHARGLRVDAELMRKSAIVVDIGSSTTDFAYIVDGRQQSLSLFGDTNLGGGLLDELILEEAVRRSPDAKALSAVFAHSPAWRSYCELAARRLKERYFEDEARWQSEPLRAQAVVCYDETLMLDLSLDGETAARLIHTPLSALGGRSVEECLRDALRAAREASRDCPPQVMILTGGASRMAFFQQACREAFPDALAVLCPEPECSIARGLAYAGRVDENLAVFRREIASLARGDKLRAEVGARIHALYAPLAGALFDAAQESAVEAVALWRRGGVGTLKELEEHTAKCIAQALSDSEARERVTPVLAEWTDGLMRALEGELQSLCLRCGVPAERMTFSGAQVDAGLHGVALSLPQALGVEAFSTLLGVVLAVVGASLCGGSGLALIGTGPAGIIAGAVAGVLVALLGKSGMERMIKSAHLPVFLRGIVSDEAVKKGLQKQRAQAEASIVQALADPRNGFEARLCAALGDTLGAQMERMARSAEMSIEL